MKNSFRMRKPTPRTAVAALQEPILGDAADKLIAKLKKQLAKALDDLPYGTRRTPEETIKWVGMYENDFRRQQDNLRHPSERFFNYDDARQLTQWIINGERDIKERAEGALFHNPDDLDRLATDRAFLAKLTRSAANPDNWADAERLAVFEWYQPIHAAHQLCDKLVRTMRRATGKEFRVNPGATLPAAAEETEKLFHVSLYADDLVKNGFAKQKPTGRTGVGNFGDVGDAISFTYSRMYARQILSLYTVLWQIANGKLTAERAAATYKVSLPDTRDQRTGGLWEDLLDDQNKRKQVRTDHGLKAFKRFLKAYETKVQYHAVIGDDKLYAQLRKVPLNSLGIIKAEVRTGGAEYRPGEHELRVPACAVVKVLGRVSS